MREGGDKTERKGETMKLPKNMPKILILGSVLMVAAGVIANVATAPAVAKYNEIRNKMKGG